MSWAELLTAAEGIRAAAAAAEPSLAALPVIGVGWATVDAERASAELDAVIGERAAWPSQARASLLGARVVRREPSPDAGVDLLVLEPDTEGRLAAFLARYGEGVGAVYLSPAGTGVDRVTPVHPRWGPFAIVRGRAG